MKINIFKGFKRKKSVYTLLKENKLSDNLNGQYEVSVINGLEVKKSDTSVLNKAVDDFYAKKHDSIQKIDNFFMENRALEADARFMSYLFSKINFQEDALLGLSILLMRDSAVVESVKFAMLLTKYFDIRQKQRALNIFLDLSSHEEFIYYGIDLIKTIDYSIFDSIYKNIGENGKYIIEERAWL